MCTYPNNTNFKFKIITNLITIIVIIIIIIIIIIIEVIQVKCRTM